MGDRHWNIMGSLVNEAEEAGDIAPGSGQDLFCSRELKKELKKDTCMLTSAIEHSWKHQVHANTRIRYLFHQAETVEKEIVQMYQDQHQMVEALEHVQTLQNETDNALRMMYDHQNEAMATLQQMKGFRMLQMNAGDICTGSRKELTHE